MISLMGPNILGTILHADFINGAEYTRYKFTWGFHNGAEYTRYNFTISAYFMISFYFYKHWDLYIKIVYKPL